MITSVYSCDGCGRKLKGESLDTALEFSKTHDRKDIYCPERCMEHAEEFWVESSPLFAKIIRDAHAAVANHRRKFFASHNSGLKEVM